MAQKYSNKIRYFKKCSYFPGTGDMNSYTEFSTIPGGNVSVETWEWIVTNYKNLEVQYTQYNYSAEETMCTISYVTAPTLTILFSLLYFQLFKSLPVQF